MKKREKSKIIVPGLFIDMKYQVCDARVVLILSIDADVLDYDNRIHFYDIERQRYNWDFQRYIETRLDKNEIEIIS